MDKTVAFHNLGCKVNLYEMEKMMKDLTENGFRIVPFDQKADIFVINTCSVTNIADRKSRQMIHRARANNPEALIVAAGCYGDTHGKEETLSELADICVLNKEKKDLVSILVKGLEKRGVSPEEDGFAKSGSFCEVTDSLKDSLHTRRFVKVQDGCDRFCSYCIIPYARGRITSRPVSEVVEEVGEYAVMGYREIVPTGIHISSYGKDRPDEGEDLISLIKAVAAVPGVERVRLSSLEPMIVTENFAKELSKIPEICPHFHLSLQSGCDSVLKRMNRHYTSEQFAQSVDLLRRYFADPAITTDIITGFPGESDEDFSDTVDFVKRIGFYETHIFKYSRRKGTVADTMPGQLTEKVKHERSTVLMEINEKAKRAFEDRHIASDKEEEVLLEDTEKRKSGTLRTGYTREYIKVYTDPRLGAEGEILKGHLERNKDGDIIIS